MYMDLRYVSQVSLVSQVSSGYQYMFYIPQNSPRIDDSVHHTLVLRINFTGTSFTPRVATIVASSTLSFHCCVVSPASSTGAILKSRSSIVRKQTTSVVANLRPIHVRGPTLAIHHRMSTLPNWLRDSGDAPMLKAENASDSTATPFHRDGIYSSGLSKYLGLYSGICMSQ